MRAIGYIRVSGKSQVDGDGPDRQRIAIESFCDDNEVELQSTRFEQAVSGTVEGMDRPEFASMVEHIEINPEVQCIVVERLDRLARDLMVQELLLRECRTRGIKVFAVDQGRLDDMADDGGDPTRVLIRQVMGAIAQWEKSQIVKKLGSARARKKEKTGRCEGRYRFGEGKDLQEKKILHSILEMHDAGIKPRFIVNGLEAQGFKNPGTNMPYSQSFINRLIRRHRPTPL
jgi:DNA invertase Pin-like site-specific DNA recombinase